MPSCGAGTYLFSSHPTTDASEASASRVWGPCRPVSPKGSIKASHGRDSQQARGVPGQRDGRSAASTVCHETPQNAMIRPFFLATSEIGCTKKKAPIEGRLESTRRRRQRLFCHTSFRGPEIKNLDRGTGGVKSLSLASARQPPRKPKGKSSRPSPERCHATSCDIIVTTSLLGCC